MLKIDAHLRAALPTSPIGVEGIRLSNSMAGMRPGGVKNTLPHNKGWLARLLNERLRIDKEL